MRTLRCIIVFIYLLGNTQVIQCKLKILALLPFYGKSHFSFAEVLFEELARRGHDVTVLSYFPKKEPFPNYHDISLTSSKFGGAHTANMDEITSLKRLEITSALFNNGLNQICLEALKHPNVQKLLQSNERYDLIITEMFNADCFLGFVHKFNVPNVAIATSTLPSWLNDRTGSPDHPAYIPDFFSGHSSRMSFLQRLDNVFNYVASKILYQVYDVWCEEEARKYFGQDMPSLNELAKNTSLYLINSHFVHQYARPLAPKVKEVGGLHVRETKPLPDDLENWISGATDGLIYLNLGSRLSPASMSEEKKLAFLKSLGELPHRVLMKWGSAEKTPGCPDNIKLSTWLPQNDILHHPNVKLFITHGGMLGTTEAVHAGVPLLVIPFFGDQLTNAALIEERGLGVVLHYRDISYETLSKTLRKLLYNPRYSQSASDLSAAFKDRPVPPLDEAVYWIEYVARHRGTHAEDLLRSSAMDLHLYQYLLLDVLAAFALSVLLICLILRSWGKFLQRLISNKSSTTIEKKES